MTKKISNILVALDLSGMDDILIKYAAFLADRLNAENVYFVHNIKKYEISDLFEEQLSDVNLEEVIGDELNDKVEAQFKSSANWEVLISDDPYSESLIKYIVEKYAIQLALVGNKNKEKGIGVLSSKLLRLLKCDLLAVPSAARTEIDVIWAGTDFSPESRKVFRVTRELQKNLEADLELIHVYSVPVQFSPYVSPDAMAPKVENHVKEKFRKFLKKVDYEKPIEPKIFLGRESAVARILAAKVKNSKADILVMGAKGGNTFSPFALGTVTEEIFNENLRIPVWVVK